MLFIVHCNSATRILLGRHIGKMGCEIASAAVHPNMVAHNKTFTAEGL
jgi:hypothetical protein